MPRTSISRELLKELELGTARKEEILAHLAESEGRPQLDRRGEQVAIVTVEWCDPAVRVPVRQREPVPLARGTRAVAEGEPVLLATVPLYRFDAPDRVDVIRIGRLPSQDVQVLDPLVSREHALIIMGERVPLLCDYGTLRDAGRSGSMNGTWVNGAGPIKDTIVSWLPAMIVEIGTEITRHGKRRFSTRITYELVRPTDDTALN